ncbi:hypothetical protein C8A05DRAFT_34967 [Staphylotrichum tortipilum]|uniref:Uncharacterized protein n=1 Tax=Staphylotrichum tortipilum TaxID=2831512 RepID=A0AAN6RSX7_9PEZI|nr:hypothetical protein C8A05DRAFT_34967 [Staphylotrichum longicolle]
MTTTPTYRNYCWREATPGIWQRDADEAEVFYSSLVKLYEGSGRMHFAITGHISLTVDVPGNATSEATAPLVDDSLRAAWLRLRHEIPTIAAQVRWDAPTQKWIKVYETVPSRAAQEAWLESTFKPISTGQTGAEWANSDPPAPPRATLFVIIPPQTSRDVVRRDLVLRSPHDIIDGIGTLHLFDQLIALFSSILAHPPTTPATTLLTGEETTRLSPPYRIAAAVPSRPTPAHVARLTALRAAKDNPLNYPSILNLSLPFQPGATIPSRHQRLSHTLTPSQTTALLAALKPLSATPTHAFHASIALVLRDAFLARRSPLPPTITRLRYNNYLLRNDRPACVAPYNTPAHAAAVYHSTSTGQLSVTLSPRPSGEDQGEFMATLAQIRAHYMAIRNDPDHTALAPQNWAAATPVVEMPGVGGGGGGVMTVPPPNQGPTVSISSMGLIDRVVQAEREGGRVRVYEPWVTGEELGTGLGVFLGTFRGRMEVSVAYNEAWRGREEVEGLLGQVVEGVMRGVGLDG